MPFASIDIGSNTINILIAKATDAGLESIFFERIPAQLGKGGMQEGILTEEAIERGLIALKKHSASCEEYGVTQVSVTATSAVRTASNGTGFVEQVKKETGLEIEVIDGDREAELIWKGVRLTGLLDKGPALIMDIGGGSTEFIIADDKEVHWKKSYRLGVTRLKERYQLSDPFVEYDEALMKSAMAEEIADVFEQSRSLRCTTLIGASGSFNSLCAMLAKGDLSKVDPMSQTIELGPYRALSEFIRNSPTMMRKRLDGLVSDRVPTIPYSCSLIDLVLETLSISKIWRSNYALKEGVVSELMENEKV